MRAALLAVCGACALSVAPISAQTSTEPADLTIQTLSSRPDLVSGGDALVGINGPSAVIRNLTVTLNGTDISAAFRTGREPNTMVGHVTGLRLGPNELAAGPPGRSASKRLTLVNRPITGPVLSAPHQTPFLCQTELLGVGAPLDANCSIKTRVEYFYRPAGATAAGADAEANRYKPFDPAGPRPADVMTTTTTEGQSVPYIIRREMGTINRAVYVIAFLHDPAQPLPTPWTTSPGWNGRLIYAYGGGCGSGYRQGDSVGGLGAETSYLEPGQLGGYPLAKGYAIASSSLNVYGTSCNDLISAESMTMVKERFIELVGVPQYTIGSGRSGGSMQQHSIANNYPGLLDGITPTASFADAMTFQVPLRDCELLDQYFKTTTLAWTMEQKVAVTGHSVYAYCGRNGSRYPSLRADLQYHGDEAFLPAALVYNRVTNPKGARFTYQDNLVNVFGRDPATGFARAPWDNVGVQYGLGAFKAGKISFDQFADLNQRLGGFDVDGHIVAKRTVADPEALRIAHQTGRLTDARQGLSQVPIIDVRPYTDHEPTGNVHDIVHGHITRARLIAANGHADNQVFRTYAPGTEIQKVQQDNLVLLDQWLANMARDQAPARSALEKVVRNKPRGLVDACFTMNGEQITDAVRCRDMFPVFSNPRLVAGEPMTQDRLKCQLKPATRGDYGTSMTDAQLERLRAVFPEGVCDYSRPGAGQVPAITWLSYPRQGDAPGVDRAAR